MGSKVDLFAEILNHAMSKSLSRLHCCCFFFNDSTSNDARKGTKKQLMKQDQQNCYIGPARCSRCRETGIENV